MAGSNSSEVVSAGNMLFSVDATTGNISTYSGTPGQWTQIGGPGHQLAGTEDDLYGISPDKSGVWRLDGATLQWAQIGGQMDKLITARHVVHGVDEHGLVWMYSGTPNQCMSIGGPFRDIDANDDFCFAVAADGSSVSMAPCGTTTWTRIGGAMETVWATGNAVYDVRFAGYDGWIKFLMNGTNEHRLNRTHFERGARYMFPAMTGQAPVSSLRTLMLQGEKHFLPDHWTVGEITAWNLETEFMYHFTVNEDIPNELDRPKSWLSVSPDDVRQTAAPPNPAYVYIWTYVAFNDAVGHASMMLSERCSLVE